VVRKGPEAVRAWAEAFGGRDPAWKGSSGRQWASALLFKDVTREGLCRFLSHIRSLSSEERWQNSLRVLMASWKDGSALGMVEGACQLRDGEGRLLSTTIPQQAITDERTGRGKSYITSTDQLFVVDVCAALSDTPCKSPAQEALAKDLGTPCKSPAQIAKILSAELSARHAQRGAPKAQVSGGRAYAQSREACYSPNASLAKAIYSVSSPAMQHRTRDHRLQAAEAVAQQVSAPNPEQVSARTVSASRKRQGGGYTATALRKRPAASDPETAPPTAPALRKRPAASG